MAVEESRLKSWKRFFKHGELKPSGRNYFRLFLTTLYLSAFTFGGGYVIISLMKKSFVDRLAWMSEEEMLNIAALAQSAPGAIAVNASILVGWKLLGFTGAIVAVLGTVIPPLLTLSTIAYFYDKFRENPIIKAVLKALMAGVSAVIFDVVLSLGQNMFKSRKLLPLLMFALSLFATYFCKINLMYIIIFCACSGAIIDPWGRKYGKELF